MSNHVGRHRHLVGLTAGSEDSMEHMTRVIGCTYNIRRRLGERITVHAQRTATVRRRALCRQLVVVAVLRRRRKDRGSYLPAFSPSSRLGALFLQYGIALRVKSAMELKLYECYFACVGTM